MKILVGPARLPAGEVARLVGVSVKDLLIMEKRGLFPGGVGNGYSRTWRTSVVQDFLNGSWEERPIPEPWKGQPSESLETLYNRLQEADKGTLDVGGVQR